MKKIISTLLVTILICTMFSTCGFAAKSTTSEVKKETLKFYSKEFGRLDNIMDAKNYDIAGVDYEAVKEVKADNVKQILDHGTIMVINHADNTELQKLADELDILYAAEEKTSMQTTIGACLRKQDDDSYLMSEVIAEIAKQKIGNTIVEPNEEEIKKSLAWLEQNAKIDLTQQYYEATTENKRFAELSASNSSSSSGSTDQLMGKSFARKSVYYYLYSTSSSDNNYTIYLDNQDSSKYQLGVIHICMIGLKTKTDGKETIDSFVADFTATAKNDLKVKEFHGKLGTPAESRYNIYSASELEPDSSHEVSASLVFNSDGSVGAGLAYSYIYKTGGIDIVNHVASSAYSNWWNATPISPDKNASYTISPNMMVGVSNGTTTAAEARATFSYLYLHKSVTAGWVADQDKVVSIKYKSHKQA